MRLTIVAPILGIARVVTASVQNHAPFGFISGIAYAAGLWFRARHTGIFEE